MAINVEGICVWLCHHEEFLYLSATSAPDQGRELQKLRSLISQYVGAG